MLAVVDCVGGVCCFFVVCCLLCVDVCVLLLFVACRCFSLLPCGLWLVVAMLLFIVR